MYPINIIKTVASSVALLLINPSFSYAGWFGPSNFDECILASMKGVTSDAAAGIIYDACESKFPKRTLPTVPLPLAVLKNVTGNAAAESYGYFKGHIYNGNIDWTITELNIVIGTKADPKTGKREFQRQYTAKIDAAPLSNSDLTVPIGVNNLSNLDWNIISGRGYKNK